MVGDWAGAAVIGIGARRQLTFEPGNPMSVQYKKVAFLARRPDLSDDAFGSYWRQIHGPLVASSPGYAAYRHRYVQNHVLAPGPVGDGFAFAGMAEFWLPGDNED